MAWRNDQVSQLETQKIIAAVSDVFSDVREIVRANSDDQELAFVTGDMVVADQEKAVAAIEATGIHVLSKIRIADL